MNTERTNTDGKKTGKGWQIDDGFGGSRLLTETPEYALFNKLCLLHTCPTCNRAGPFWKGPWIAERWQAVACGSCFSAFGVFWFDPLNGIAELHTHCDAESIPTVGPKQ